MTFYYRTLVFQAHHRLKMKQVKKLGSIKDVGEIQNSNPKKYLTFEGT